MPSTVRKILSGLCILSFITFVISASVVVAILQAGATAPASVEPRDLQYDAPPEVVVTDALTNLQATSYTVDLRVEDTGDRADVSGWERTGPRYEDGPVTTMEANYEINNPARRYAATHSILKWDGNVTTTEYYSESPSIGWRYGTSGDVEKASWESHRRHNYRILRNQLVPRSSLSAEDVILVHETETTYEARVTDSEEAMELAYSGSVGIYGVLSQTLSNANANMTVVIHKATGLPIYATFEYYNHVADRYILATFEFSDHGMTTVQRPLGTLPPDTQTILYRLDLGFWALRPIDGVRAVIYATLVFGLVWVGRRRSGRRE